MVIIRNAKNSDKTDVLKFCRNTFSWGDYIEHVWDFWVSEGHLFLFEDCDNGESNPTMKVGICHAVYFENQAWIEGIRVDPKHRRQKVASMLIRHAESIGKEKKIHKASMLIDTENCPSLSLAAELGYEIFQTWNFYTVLPQKRPSKNVHFNKTIHAVPETHYVDSWRWIPLDIPTMLNLCDKGLVVCSGYGCDSTELSSVAILTDSAHFKKTLIVTLFPGQDSSVEDMILFLQNYGLEKKYQRIQILTRGHLDLYPSVEFHLSFHLMEKIL